MNYPDDFINKVIQGDCLEIMKSLKDSSVDSVVTDPPYGISFMGKKWDYDVPQVEVWKEVLRVLKPGGHALVACGTRTQHRMAVNLEDAGFEIRDIVAWIYGSGFPKSLNIGKQEGCEQWNGWGTALKPAMELWTLCRKPLEENTVASNVLKYGTGGINIDGSRVVYAKGESAESIDRGLVKQGAEISLNSYSGGNFKNNPSPIGRFPANLIHDGSDEVVSGFPTSSTTGARTEQSRANSKIGSPMVGMGTGGPKTSEYTDSGSASRFFKCCNSDLERKEVAVGSGELKRFVYTAKASKGERNKGLDGYLTVKYNGGICKEENTVAVQLLKKVTSDTEIVSFNIDESGESITAQCHKDSLSTILTGTNRTIELKTLNSLTHFITNGFIQDVNSEVKIGGNPAESAESLSEWLRITTNGNQESARGVSRVVLKMLSLIKERENWKDATNFHSTVKPVSLMRYLCKLVAPPKGIILDPYMGSGTTGIGAKLEGFDFVGIEREEEYVKIAQARIEAWKKEETLF